MYGQKTRYVHDAGGETVRHDVSRTVEVFMAGDVEHAKQVIRRYCKDNPLCVTVTPTTFIYCGGEEAGFVVGVRNYPRFPSVSETAWGHATAMAITLREDLAQDSYMIAEHGGDTVWSSHKKA